MAKLVIIWPTMERPEDFDTDYLNNHVPLASKLPGGSLYTSPVAGRGAHRATIISYPDETQLRASLASDIGAKCQSDTARLSGEFGVRPTVHILPD